MSLEKENEILREAIRLLEATIEIKDEQLRRTIEQLSEAKNELALSRMEGRSDTWMARELKSLADGTWMNPNVFRRRG